MEDFEAFQGAMRSDDSYMSTFSQSLSLVLDEFYKNLRSVGVSAVSGAGMDAFFKAIEASAEEYMETYKYFLLALDSISIVMINYFLSTTNMLLSRFICLTNGS
jgi:hypothetical protein